MSQQYYIFVYIPSLIRSSLRQTRTIIFNSMFQLNDALFSYWRQLNFRECCVFNFQLKLFETKDRNQRAWCGEISELKQMMWKNTSQSFWLEQTNIIALIIQNELEIWVKLRATSVYLYKFWKDYDRFYSFRVLL